MARISIDTPTRGLAAPGGLLRVANVITNIPPGAFHFGLQYQADHCGQNRVIPAEGVDKIADKSGLTVSAGFGQYRLVEDALLVDNDAEEVARRLFAAGESYGVEQGVQEHLLNPAAVNITPTPGTPVTNMKHALGLLEQYAADNYSGLPIIHGNRLAVTLIPELQAGANGELKTIHGTPIANGGGYDSMGPGAANATAGRAWIYISGQVNVWRGAPSITTVEDLKGNRVYTLAEARYLASVECFVAAILVGAS